MVLSKWLNKLVWAALLAAAGCATPPPAPPREAALADPARLAGFEFSGRLAVVDGERGHYANVLWQTRGKATHVLLSSPLGQAVAQMDAVPGEVRLTTADGATYTGASGDDLAQRVLGYRLPVEGLRFWLFARPAPAGASRASAGPDGRPQSLEQAGWSIRYADYRAVEGAALPGRMELRRGELVIRLVFDRWDLAGGP